MNGVFNRALMAKNGGLSNLLSRVVANTPPCKKGHSSLRFLSIFLILFLAVGNAWGQETVIIGSYSGAFTLESNHEVAGYSGGTNSSTLTSASDGFGASKGSKLGSTSNIGSKLSSKNHIRFKIDAGEKVRFYYYQTSGTNKETTFATSDYSQSANYYHTPTPYTAAQKNTLYYVDFEFTNAGTYAISVTSGQSVYAAGLLFTPSAPVTTPVTTVTIDGGENAYVGVTKTLSATTDVAATEYKWEVNGVDQGVNAATFDFTPAADGTYNVVCKARNEYNDAGAYVSSSVLQITAGKLCGELIKATHTDETTATVEGVLGGTVDKKTQSGGKLGSNDHYFGVKLAAGTFLAGDIVTIYASTVSSKVQIFSDKGTTMINEGVFDGNYYTYTLTEATEWIYLYRTSSEGSSMNPTLGYISVSRSCEKSNDCSIKTLTINGEEITPEGDVYNYEVASSTSLTVVEVSYTIHPLATGIPASGFTIGVPSVGEPANTQTITVTAEDGTSVGTYTINVTKAASASNVVTLDELSVTGFELSPAFNSATTVYTITKDYGTADPAVEKVVYTKTEEAQTVVVVYDSENHKLTITVTAEDGTTTQDYVITINEAEAPKSLTEVQFSNGCNAFIDNSAYTVKAFYLEGETEPTIAKITPNEGASAELSDGKIIVKGADETTVEYTVTITAVTPNRTTVAAEEELLSFAGTEAWLTTGLKVAGNSAAFNSEDKYYTLRRQLKEGDAADDQRVIAGLVRAYLFVGNAYKLDLFIGKKNTAIKYRIGTGAYTESSDGSVSIPLETAGNYMVEIVTNQKSGDAQILKYRLVEMPTVHTITYKAGVGEIADVVDNAAITVAGCPVSFVNEGYLFAGWKDESDNDVAVGSAVASDMILTAQWVINPCPDRKSLSKIVLTSATEGNVTGYNSNEYAGEAVIAALDGTEVADLDGDSNNETGYKLNSGGKSILFATLSKGLFQTGDEVVVGITKANDHRTISDSKAIMTIYAGSDKDNTIELGTLTNVDKAGYYTYALTEADITAINAAGYKSVGLFRASENGQNHYVYSVEITGCRDWSVFYTLTFKNEDGTVTIAEKALAEGDYANSVAPAAPKNFGYHFKGWSEEIGGELVDLPTYTPTEDKTLYAVYEKVVCPTSGTIFAFQMKTDLTNGNVFASAPKAELMTTENYLSTLQGGEVEVSITGTNNNRVQFYDNKAIGFANGTGGQIAIDMDCAIQTGDVLRFINYASSGNIITLSDGTNTLTLDGNKEETIQEIVFTEAWNGAYKLTMVRANNTPKLTYFEIYRRPVLTGVTLSDITILEGAKVTPTMTLSPSEDAIITSQVWSVVSGDDKITIDPTTGEVTGVAEGTAVIKVVLNGDEEKFSATATITIITEYTQADVTESITWDWTVAAMDEVGTENGSTEYLMANVSSAVPNNENFRSDMLLITAQYANRNATNQFFQGTKIRFNTTVDGLVRVYFRGTGKDEEIRLTINGEEASTHMGNFVWSNYIEVPAGEVTILGTNTADPAKLTRIQKIEFLALGHRREASWIVPNELGTVCLKDECIIKGAELYELQGPDANRKLVFDEIPSGELEAGKPYLFNATATRRISFYNKVNAAHTETAGSLNGMYGTFEDLTFSPATDQNIYYFSGHNIWAVKKNTADVLLPAYLCYVKMDELLASPVPDANPAPGRRRVTLGVNGQNVTTGVENVDASTQPTKVLINGQLFILRGEKMYDATGKLVK